MMDLNKTREIQRFIDLWSSRKKSGRTHTKEDWDKRSIEWVRELEEDEDRKERSEKIIKETAEYLRSKCLLQKDDLVADIGCGPGRFVAEFAKTSGHVTGIDISPLMCKFGKEYVEARKIKNADFIACDFQNTDIDEFGWRKKFDLVFSSITPAMSSYENFRKAEEMSRKYCFQSNFVKVVDDFEDMVLKNTLPEELLPPKRDLNSLYAMFNILLLEGKYPEIRFYKAVYNKNRIVDEMLLNEILKNAPMAPQTEEFREKLMEEILRHCNSEGLVEIYREWHYGWILWDVRS